MPQNSEPCPHLRLSTGTEGVTNLASKRAIRRRSCEGKRLFSTFAEAERAAAAMQRNAAGALHAYRCDFSGRDGKTAGHYHVGHLDDRIEFGGEPGHGRRRATRLQSRFLRSEQ